MKKSGFLKLETKDWLRGFGMAVGTAILTAVYTSLQSGSLPTVEELSQLGVVGLTAGVAYILKNLGTNSDDKFLKSEK